MDPGAKFLFGKPALIEELAQKRILGFGNVFDQLAVQTSDFILPLALGGRFRYLPFPPGW